jgi:hypothetical protein
MGKLMN